MTTNIDMSENEINSALRARLTTTFHLYIRHAIEHALDDRRRQIDVLQVVVNLQAGLELLCKLYALRREGWKEIVEEQFHDKSQEIVLAAINNGTIKTKAYWQHKNYISEQIVLDDIDKSLINNFQSLRNQVMHLGVVAVSEDVLSEAIWLIVRVVNQLEWHETLPEPHRHMSNNLKALLGCELYEKLISNSSYVAETIDRMNELCIDDVRYCLECGNESWAEDEEGYLFCHVCGFKGNEEIFGFLDCPRCKVKKGVIYDALNVEFNQYIPGKCGACRKIVQVSQCKECKFVTPYRMECPICSSV